MLMYKAHHGGVAVMITSQTGIFVGIQVGTQLHHAERILSARIASAAKGIPGFGVGYRSASGRPLTKPPAPMNGLTFAGNPSGKGNVFVSKSLIRSCFVQEQTAVNKQMKRNCVDVFIG